MMDKLGWETCSMEPDIRSAQLARDAGLDIYTGTLEQAAFPDIPFGVVVMLHVLEHVPDPVATLVEIVRILRPNDLLSLAVPHCGSLGARLFQEQWFGWNLRRHLMHFTPYHLPQMLEGVGMQRPM